MGFGAISLMRWHTGGHSCSPGGHHDALDLRRRPADRALHDFRLWRDTYMQGRPRGLSYPRRVAAPALRHDPVHRLRGDVLRRLFWAFFDASLFANEAHQVLRVEHTGGVWPPKGVEVFSPWHLPLLQHLHPPDLRHHGHLGAPTRSCTTTVAASSGVWCLRSPSAPSSRWCRSTSTRTAAFAFSGNIYGATFFMATGFHGFHVFVAPSSCWSARPRHRRRFTPAEALRLRGGGLVLALRRRGLALPVRLHLRVGRLGRHHPPGLSPSDRNTERRARPLVRLFSLRDLGGHEAAKVPLKTPSPVPARPSRGTGRRRLQPIGAAAWGGAPPVPVHRIVMQDQRTSLPCPRPQPASRAAAPAVARAASSPVSSRPRRPAAPADSTSSSSTAATAPPSS